jgi:hypothetical protein
MQALPQDMNRCSLLENDDRPKRIHAQCPSQIIAFTSASPPAPHLIVLPLNAALF